MFRYWSVIRPARELLEAQEREELLAEGKSTV